MFCTTECWDCEDKTCEHYIQKSKLYFKSKQQEKEIERLNKILEYLEKYFSEREYYEFAQLVRDTKEADIEWLNQGVK